MNKRWVWAFVIFVVVMFFLSVAVAQNPEKINGVALWAPHFGMGDMGNGITWVTYLTFFNRSQETQWINFGLRGPKGENITPVIEFHDGQRGIPRKILPGRPPLSPGKIERVALYPCAEPDAVPGVDDCQGHNGLQVGFIEFRTSATWDDMLKQYIPDKQIQVTLQAIRDGIAFASLSYQPVTIKPDAFHFTFEVQSTEKASTGIALALAIEDAFTEGTTAQLTLRDPRGEKLAEKKLILRWKDSQYPTYLARMFDELFPEFARKLPLGTLEVDFNGSAGLTLSVKVDYAIDGEARISNTTSFPTRFERPWR